MVTEQLGRALNALRNVHIQAWYEANGSRATAAVRTERTSAGRSFPRDGGEQEGRAETSDDRAFSAPSSSDEKEGGAVSPRGTTAPPVVTASSPAVQPRRQHSSLRSDAAAAADNDGGGSAAAGGAGAGPVAKNPLRESLRREKHHQRQQHQDYKSSRENEFKVLDSPQTAAVTSADSAPSSKGPRKSRSNSLPSEADDAVAASTAGTVGGNDGKRKRQCQESQPPRSPLPAPLSSARVGGGGDERRGYRAGLETMAAGSTEPAEAGEGRQIHYQRGDDATVLGREVKRAKKRMEAEHAVLLADRDSTISQLSGEVTKRTDENALLLVALDSAVKEMATRLSSKASAWAPMTARGRRGTGSRREVLQLSIALARQRQQQLQHLKALQQR
ncbi:hypothetical protein Esi_0376_0005 [Ectocarpus siliculosus]|uniref:Uncharacterized protein n=1 Tax=Ectocarpus siliculosus TaxID=2880 RepID=D7FZJ9_ECTSI|nr:hypothetical protein Esi_0376_0005 [Ectocarpus siliculosus]|eukprot:CBJ32806.1 hypothetical protein Esi_0376_0005 [Ectocarpus siliculosus]